MIVARGLTISACIALTVACASPSTQNPPSSTADVSQARMATAVFEVGFGEAVARYIDPLTAEQLAVSGLSGLSRLDPSITVAKDGDAVRLAVQGAVRARADAPSAGDSVGWARVVTRFVEVARQSSPLVAQAAWERIYESVFDGALADLDPFSRYSSATEARDQRASRDGAGGIGIRFRRSDGGQMVVTKVLASGPAAKSGLSAGDWITHVDGAPVANLTVASLADRFEGPAGTRVRLIARVGGGGESREYTISRVHIVPETVSVRHVDGIILARIQGFNQGTAGRLRSLLESAIETRSGTKGVVLDLRGNPGGLLHQSVKVASLFLERGRIVETHGRHADSLQIFDAEGADILAGLPVAVIIDGGSASAAEIVAVALRDHRRAVVIGSTSYGKGTVQMITPLPNRGELTLTWSRLLPPSGHAFHDHGVVPSFCTSGVDEEDSRAVERIVRSASLRPDEGWRCPPERRISDIEVDVARRLLRDDAMYSRALGAMANVAGARH